MASQESIEPNESVAETLKWPIPLNIGIEKLDVIVKAFFQGQADTRSLSPAEISRLTGMNTTTLKANIKFLLALKVLKAGDGADTYTFEEKGKDYAQSLATGDMQQAGAVLKGLLNDNLKELVTFVELKKSSGNLQFEPLFLHIKAMARIRDDPKYPRGVSGPYAAGIATLISLLVRAEIAPADLLETKEVQKGIAVKKAKSPTQTKLIEPEPAIQQPLKMEQKVNAPGVNLPLTININVEANDPESIREIINLLRELRKQPEN